VLALLALLAVAAPLAAQTTSGSVSGSVRDPHGAAVPRAALRLVSVVRGTVFETTTDPAGDFVLPTVPPDRYTLKLAADGFKAVERPDVIVNANDRLALGVLTLPLGDRAETITVLGHSSELQTQGGERSFAIEGPVVQNVAVNGRSFLGLAFLAPGVVSTQPTPTGDSATLSANGQRISSNNVQIDGITDVDTGNNGGPMVALSLDSVQEFKVLTSNYQAEYGRSAGAQVSAVTKSGGRELHGSGYVFRRSDRWNANTWLNNRQTTGGVWTPAPKPRTDQRDLGYTIGGPVFIPGVFNEDRTKLFFFAGQEFQRRVTPPTGPTRVRVPTALERAGDFSQTRDNAGNLFPYIRDYTTGLPCGPADTRGCFRDGGVLGRIPANRLYAPGVDILAIYPLPNQPPGSEALGYNYVTQEPSSQPERQDLLRLDGHPSPSWRFSGKILNNSADATLPYGAFVLATNMPDHAARLEFPRRAYSLSAAGSLGEATFLEVTWGLSRNSIAIAPAGPERLTRAAMGLSDLPALFPEGGSGFDLPPQFQYAGRVAAANAPLIGTGNAPFTNSNKTQDAVVSLTKLWGRHTAKAGVSFHNSEKPQSSFALANGQISFTNDASNPYDTGFPFANAITGVYQAYTQASAYVIANYVYSNVEWYLQDNWKVSARLTLDYGVRFYWMQPQHDNSGQAANFLPGSYDAAHAPRLYRPAIVGGVRVAQDPVTGQTLPAVYIGRIVPGTGTLENGHFAAGHGIEETLYKDRGVHLGPRLGFSYDLTGKAALVLRGGAGVFYDRTQGNTVFDLVRNPPTTLEPTLRNGRLQDLAAGANILLAPPALTAYDHEGKVPTVYAFNLGVQLRLPLESVLDVSYVGSASSHLLRNRNINAPPYGAAFRPENQDPTLPPSPIPGATALGPDFLRPYLGYGDINYFEPAASSNYHSLQSSLQRRFKNGLLLGIAYTWGKALGTSSLDGVAFNAFGIARIDDNERRANYGPLNFDRRHSFVGNFVWEVPGTKAGGVRGQVLDHWQLSGVYRYQSGAPYNLTVVVPGLSGYGLTGTQGTPPARAVVVGNPDPGHSGDPYRQLDAAAFVPGSVGSLGLESGRNFLNRAPTNNWDLSLSKSFTLGGARRLELRLDAFNALNHTQFYDVNTTLVVRSLADPTPANLPFDASGKLVNPTGFGTVVSVRPPRTLQLVARFQF
jgi:hypothetical protein